MSDAATNRPTYVWDLAEEFLVRCPQCDAMAIVRARTDDRLAGARLVCAACGYARDWRPSDPGVICNPGSHEFPDGLIVVGQAVDWYFHLPLWLEASCCGESLWAYNLGHLRWLRDYVGADLRPAARTGEAWANASLSSRLPRWMKLAKNRDAVLRAIDALQRRLAG